MSRHYRPYSDHRPYSHPFAEDDIADQFAGMEIEFNDKATLFPVQVEKDERPRRRLADELRARPDTQATPRRALAKSTRPSAAIKPLRRS